MVLLFRMGHLKGHLKMQMAGEYLPRDGASERSGADDEIIDITIWKITIEIVDFSIKLIKHSDFP